MNFLDKIREATYFFATVSGAGEHFYGGAVAIVLAVPLVVMGRFAYAVSPDFFYGLFFATIIIGYLSMSLTLRLNHESGPVIIVLDRTFGAMTSFLFLPLHLKSILAVLIVFPIMNWLLNQILVRYGIELRALPGTAGIVVSDVFAGLVVALLLNCAVLAGLLHA